MPTPRYTRTARWLHWIIAILALGQIALGLAADKAQKPLAGQLLDQHVRVGLLILALMVLRLLWRLTHRPPSLPVDTPPWQRVSAQAVHSSIYLLLFLLPFSGYVLWAWIGRPLSWFGIAPIPILFEGGDDETWRSIAGYTHEYAFYVLAALLAAHIVAAFWHQFVRRDRLISDRML